jgi:hypothetical protein
VKRTRLTGPIGLAFKLGELASAAPLVVAHRVGRMASAGARTDPSDRREFVGMVTEKQLAWTQSWFAMSVELLRMQQRWWLSAWLRGPLGFGMPGAAAAWRVADRGLAPIHRKALANAKRLSRTRR